MAEPGSGQAGYTLPVWTAAAARAALQGLRREPVDAEQPLRLDPGAGIEAIPIEAAAPLADGSALAMARCDPGAGVLDLTRGLLVWVQARWLEGPGPWLELRGGEGVGVIQASGQACLSGYARQLLDWNLRSLVPMGRRLALDLTIPEGRRLAERTSNAAFGVVEGLALIGTQARVQRSAAPEQLEEALGVLRQRAAAPGFAGDLVLVIGENGLDLAPRLGLPAALLLKAGNWLGPLLVAAAEAGVRRLLLFGVQGKLIKLAGGIFHTHHHLADGRAEVLTALAALEGLAGSDLARLHAAPSVETALSELEGQHPELAARLRARIAAAIEQRSQAYLRSHGQSGPLAVGAVLFDRRRRVRACGPEGQRLLAAFGAAAVEAPGGDP
ncbi:cobalt-precorrin-5B (C(1))-methyltransferase [Cyanobium sp. ATX 6A2]|uniref:cobalt-precorrin-5B (C(1))-methyltransferase CbiD n=1 Tax=Cyanobium sp. ATX 6A2 TaxID=2823700 RepID=UPI0020CF19F7|nr:cobalt-precorrin-5B (C(1))-methyltransferase CbiD [Cyanobium sp. ATX 6A2]MCP9886948.1 cobalt-precorrin-5B (C(1))-methyltransferase [Cyanobium sp. ATX 6A2]